MSKNLKVLENLDSDTVIAFYNDYWSTAAGTLTIMSEELAALSSKSNALSIMVVNYLI